jgi:hypothetical protein
MAPQLLEIYEDLPRHPGLSMQEHRTAGIAADYIAARISGQSDLQASSDAVSLYSIWTGIPLRRSNNRTSPRIGHQS